MPDHVMQQSKAYRAAQALQEALDDTGDESEADDERSDDTTAATRQPWKMSLRPTWICGAPSEAVDHIYAAHWRRVLRHGGWRVAGALGKSSVDCDQLVQFHGRRAAAAWRGRSVVR